MRSRKRRVSNPEVLPPVLCKGANPGLYARLPRPVVPEGMVRLVGCPHPLRMDRIDAVAAAGPTLAEMVAKSCDDLRVPAALRGFGYAWIDGKPCPHEQWGQVRPAPGSCVVVRVFPAGNGTGKSITRAVMMLAIVVIAAYSQQWYLANYGTSAYAGISGAVAGYTAGSYAAAYAVGATVMVAGTMAVNALVRVKPQSSSGSQLSPSSAAEDTVYSVAGTSNVIDPWGPVPMALGFIRWAPKHGARPYTEIAGSDQYIRAILDWGLGPLVISDKQIGDTSLGEFDEVQEQTVQGFPDTDPTQDLFTQDIYEEPLSILLSYDDEEIRTTGEEADECSVDISASSLADWTGGSKKTRTVEFSITYREHGTEGDWINNDELRGIVDEQLQDESWGCAAVNFDYGEVRVFYGSKANFYIVNRDWVYDDVAKSWSIVESYEPRTIPDVAPAGWLPVVFFGGESYESYGALGLVLTPEPQGWTGLDPVLVGTLLSVADGLRTAQLTLSAASSQAVRGSRRIVFPSRGQYDVKVLRITEESSSAYVYDDCYWAALRTITRQPPITVDWNNATTQIRILATGELNGSLDKVNGLTKTWCPDWDATAEEWVDRETQNPASLYRWLLQNEFNPASKFSPITDAKIDLDALEEWHAFCISRRYMYNRVINMSGHEGFRDVLTEIASAGRAIECMVDGKWSVVIDQPRPDEVPFDFTADMIVADSVSISRDLREAPHALRMPFLNEETWEDDELIVYAPGYLASNAKIYEILRVPGLTNADAVAEHGMYHLGCLHLRRETMEWGADFACIAIRGRGSLCTVSHHVIGTGLARGRVKAVESNAGNLLVTVNESCPMASGASYRALFRKVGTGARGVRSVQTNPGLQTILTLPPAAGGVVPEAGDIFAFGLEGLETRTLIVTGIRGGADLSATITGVDYAWPELEEFMAGATVEWSAKVTRSPWVSPNKPAAPVFVSIASDESVLVRDSSGNFVCRIVVDYALPSGLVAAETVQLQYREQDGAWSSSISTPAGQTLAIDGVVQGQTYGLRLRSVGRAGAASAWTAETEHEVVGKSSLPPDVDALSASQNGGLVTFRWPRVVVQDLKGYELRYAARGAFVWADASLLTSITADLAVVTASLPPGDWTVGIKAVDTNSPVSLYSETEATCDIVVGNANEVIYSQEQAPDWPGTLYNALIHPLSRRVVPLSTLTAEDAGWDLFDQFVPSPVSEFGVEAEEFDAGFDSPNLRVWGELSGALGPGETSGSPNAVLQVDSRTSAGAYAGFKDVGVGIITARYVKFRAIMRTADGVGYLATFRPTVDVPERTESGGGESISDVGSDITFSAQFHNSPRIIGEASNAAANRAVFSPVTASNATCTIYDRATQAAVADNLRWWEATGA